MKNILTLLLIIVTQLNFAQNANIPDLDGVYQTHYIAEDFSSSTRAAFTQVANFPMFLDSFV